MITLDYKTYNPRWGRSGIKYSSWETFAFALGYLANRVHYRRVNNMGLIELHFERNDMQGAWGEEGRIHYYGTDIYLSSTFADWYDAKSAGVNNITYRINSNDYMYSLVHDFGFEERIYEEHTTADIFPPVYNPFGSTWEILENHLVRIGKTNRKIGYIHSSYEEGWYEQLTI